jgi:hypothetical protein
MNHKIHLNGDSFAPQVFAAKNTKSSKQITGPHAGTDYWESLPETVVAMDPRLAFSTKDACRVLGGISARSLRRLEQRGLLMPSRGLRTKLYSLKSIERYLEASK